MGIPLYITIQNYIKEKIDAGQWQAGYMLPTEKELSQMFGVSRITVTTALRELVKDGIIYRIQGKGTFVSTINQSIEEDISNSSYAEVEDMQLPGEHRCLKINRCHPNHKIAELLQIGEQQVIVFIERMKYVDKQPSFVERFYLPAKYYLAATDEQLGTLHMSQLARVCDLKLAKNVVSSEAVLADAEIMDLLQLQKGQPILYTTLEIYNNVAEPIAYIEVFNSNKQKQVFTGGKVGLD